MAAAKQAASFSRLRIGIILSCTLFKGNANASSLNDIVDVRRHRRQEMFFRPVAFRAIGIGVANVPSFVPQFYGDIHTDIVYSHTEYDVIIYFWSEVIGGNCRFYRLRRLLGEFLENRSS